SDVSQLVRDSPDDGSDCDLQPSSPRHRRSNQIGIEPTIALTDLATVVLSERVPPDEFENHAVDHWSSRLHEIVNKRSPTISVGVHDPKTRMNPRIVACNAGFCF